MDRSFKFLNISPSKKDNWMDKKILRRLTTELLLLLLLSRFSRVWLCATPYTTAHQAPPSLGFSRQEHWSGLPLPSPMHESEKWKWSHSVVSDSQRPHGLQPTRLLCPWDFPGKSTGVGCHCLQIQHSTEVLMDQFSKKKKIQIRKKYLCRWHDPIYRKS